MVEGDTGGDGWEFGDELGKNDVLEAELGNDSMGGDGFDWAEEDLEDEQEDDTNVDEGGEVGGERAYHWPGSALRW